MERLSNANVASLCRKCREFHPPLEGGSESEAIRGGVRVAPRVEQRPLPEKFCATLADASRCSEFYRPSLKGRVKDHVSSP